MAAVPSGPSPAPILVRVAVPSAPSLVLFVVVTRRSSALVVLMAASASADDRSLAFGAPSACNIALLDRHRWTGIAHGMAMAMMGKMEIWKWNQIRVTISVESIERVSKSAGVQLYQKIQQSLANSRGKMIVNGHALWLDIGRYTTFHRGTSRLAPECLCPAEWGAGHFARWSDGGPSVVGSRWHNPAGLALEVLMTH